MLTAVLCGLMGAGVALFLPVVKTSLSEQSPGLGQAAVSRLYCRLEQEREKA